jgi:DNA-binding CsgD family transcriptional regulator
MVAVAAAGGDFVRAVEWRRVRDFTEGAAVRHEPAALVLQGEAGSGKSTLWRAGVKTAADAGCRVLRSELSASEADASFAALSDLLAGILPLLGPDIPGPQREALEVALLLRPPGDQPAAAHAISLAVLAALRLYLDSGPVLVAIDDVQWLDAGSQEALAFAFRRITAGPLSVLLTARSEAPTDPLTVGAPPLRHAWRHLLAAPAAEEIMLAPLDAWQIQHLLPARATAAQARLVARESRGNMFWAREIWTSLDAADAPVPPLASAQSDRLWRMLTPPAQDAVATVAAAGRITIPGALAVLGHLQDPAAALDEAALAGLLVETEGRLAIAHPLIGAAALDAMPPGRRAGVYRRLAAAAENPERRAHFAALAAGAGPDPEVADALDAAAAAAHARAANVAAADFAAQAVTFTPESDAAALVRRRIRAGELLFLAGEIDRSLEHLEALDARSLAPADLERALPLLIDMVDWARGPAAAADMVAAAVDTVGDEPRSRAIVLALASDVMYGIRGGRRTAAQQAIAAAEAAGQAATPTLHRALLNLVTAKVTAGDGLDAELLDRAERLEPAMPATPVYDTADLSRGVWSCVLEDLDTARAALRRSIARARGAGDDYSQYAFWCYLATTEELAGDYTTAATALAAADALDAWHDWPAPYPWHLEPRCGLLIATGMLDEALAVAERMPDDAPSVLARFVGACVRGKVSMWRGDAAAAVQHFEQAAWCADQYDWADPGVRSRLDPLLAEAYVIVGRPADADRIAAWLREIGLRLDRPALIGDAYGIDALVAAVRGDLDAAAESARAAVAAHERSPLRPELARSLLTLGRIERRRRARRQSRVALAHALDLATEMGHQTLLAQIDQELPRTAPERSAAELTDAERRVADQIASGATNREAAAALFVSVRTVETHVGSIYRKLGVHTRSELRRALVGARGTYRTQATQ